jgi:hypothetical protein
MRKSYESFVVAPPIATVLCAAWAPRGSKVIFMVIALGIDVTRRSVLRMRIAVETHGSWTGANYSLQGEYESVDISTQTVRCTRSLGTIFIDDATFLFYLPRFVFPDFEIIRFHSLLARNS